MSIYPKEIEEKMKDLVMDWDIAVYDVAIPSNLTKDEDGNEWGRYVSCLSPQRQLRKFAQALDQLHDLMEKVSDPAALTEKEKITIYSKWHAASIINASVFPRFQYAMDYSRKFNSNVEQGIFYITDFLKSVRSADVQVWEDRRAKINSITQGAVFNSIYADVIDVKRSVNNNPNGIQF